MKILNMIKLFILGSVLTILLISTTALTAASLSSLADTITSSRDSGIMNAYAQTGSMATLQNIGAQYAVSVVPGASQKTNLIHYYPPLIAVPIGTTVAWFNNDPGQPHTVTSGLPNASNSGAVFNSGIMPSTANSFFQYTFNKEGNFVYHCEIHPWRVAMVSVSSGIERGNNFEMSSGVGPTLNLTKDLRALLVFAPLTVPLDKSTPLTYNVTITKSNDPNNKLFSKTFTVAGEKLPVELIARSDINKTNVYGPDFSSTGAYHVEAPFLKGNAAYDIKVEIAAINSKQPQNKIADRFSLRTAT
jgi:plastocyanin